MESYSTSLLSGFTLHYRRFGITLQSHVSAFDTTPAHTACFSGSHMREGKDTGYVSLCSAHSEGKKERKKGKVLVGGLDGGSSGGGF